MANELITICDLLADRYGSKDHPKFQVLKAESDGNGKWTLVIERLEDQEVKDDN